MALADKKLTDLTELVSVPVGALIHVVDPTDISQSPQGSSYKVKKENFGGLSDALSDGNTYGRKDAAWAVITSVLSTVLTGLSASSGTFTSSSTILTAFGKIKYLIDNIAATYESLSNKDNGTLSTSTTTYPTSGATKTAIELQGYATISGNTTLDDSYHRKTIWVTATCNITIPIGLRADFNCAFVTFTGITATFLTSGTTINTESDTSVVVGKNMCYLAVYSTNNYIIKGGL